MNSKATIRQFRIVQKEMSADMSMNTTTENSTEKTNQEIPLNEFITLQRGFDLPSRERVEGDIPVVASTGISSFHNIAKIKAPGVVIGRSGSIGGGQYITEDFWPLNTTLWVKDFKHHHPRFIYYLLKSIDFTSFNAGAAVPTLNRNHLSSIKIKPFTYEHEEQIAKVLGDLDDKIQLNQQINQTLEEMAQALFKSWFVDFEPTKAKIAALAAGGSEEDANLAAMQAISGKTATELEQLKTQNPENYQQLYTTAQHFPAAMQESELGEIPEGWEVKRFGDYLDSISKTYPLKSVDKVVFLNTGDIQNGQFLVDDYVSSIGLPGQAKKSIQKNDILYSEIRPINRRFAYVHFEAEEYVVSTKLMVLRSNEKIPSEMLYFLLTRQPIIDELQIAAESRSGTFPQIRFENVANTEFIGPSDNILFSEFNINYLHNCFSIQNNNISESKQLEKLRDTLLPKLLSGELSVPDTTTFPKEQTL